VLKWRDKFGAEHQRDVLMARARLRADPQISIQDLARAVLFGHVAEVLIGGVALPDFRPHFDPLQDDDDVIVLTDCRGRSQPQR
jgi:hypothetical protein